MFNMLDLDLSLLLISEVHTCLILMFGHSFGSLGPPLQEYGVIFLLGGL